MDITVHTAKIKNTNFFFFNLFPPFFYDYRYSLTICYFYIKESSEKL